MPGGVVAVFQGTVGFPEQRFFGIMKAEFQEAFLREANLQATFVDNLFLSPKARLYKVGIFIEEDRDAPLSPESLSALVFDSNLSSRDRDGAATYFYSSFLGLGFSHDSAFLTRKFFEYSKQFIASSALGPEEKIDLFNGLTTYIKVDQSPNVQVSEFGERYLVGDLERQYCEFMNRQGFTEAAVPKDLSEVMGQLKIRRMRFPRQIQLSGPAEARADLVTVRDIEGPDHEKWTQISIKGRLLRQE
jgi:hypothetical protein